MSKSVSKSASGKRRIQKTADKTAKPAKQSRQSVKKQVQPAVAVTELPKHKPTTAEEIGGKPTLKLPPLPSALRILRQAISMLYVHKLQFLGITAIYGGLCLALVQSMSGNLNLNNLGGVLSGSSDRVANGLVTFQWLFFGSESSNSNTTAIYEAFLLLIGSLALIWAMRQVATGQQFRIRDAYYRGMSSLVPVALVGVIVLVQLLPLLFGLGIFNLVISFGFADMWYQKLAWGLPALGLAILSFYLVTSSLIAVYIASLPDMEPGAALRSAKDLVQYRRWTVLRKIVFLLILLMVFYTLLLGLILFTVPILSPWLLFVAGVLALPLVHAYMYALYRELLQ